MALVRNFIPRPDRAVRFRSSVDCGFTIADVNDARIVRLETYGSGKRAIPGKTSQVIELDAGGAAELMKILKTAFPDLR